MADTFRLGEIAIIVSRLDGGQVIWPEYDGCECIVIGPLQTRDCWTNRARTQSKGVLCYRVRMSDGKEACALPENLRKRRLPPPPREEVGEWELCPWRPSQVTVRDDEHG